MEFQSRYPVDVGDLGVFLMVYAVLAIALGVVTVAGFWKVYVKAGHPGWASIVPIYNWWVWVEIIGRPRWWFWGMLAASLLSVVLPVVAAVFGIAMAVLYLLACLDMARAFGKGAGYGIGLWFLPFVFAPLLGFGDSMYGGGTPTTANVSAGTGSGEIGTGPATPTHAAGPWMSNASHTLPSPTRPVAPLGSSPRA
jgi:hypothetical protein